MELAFGLLRLKQLSLSISLHTARPVPQAEWDAALAQLRSLTPGGLDPEHTRMLVLSDGGAPDVSQRAQLVELWHSAEVKVAVMVPGTRLPEKRGVVTALMWVNPALGMFTPDLFRQALEHLDVRAHEAPIWSELQRLQAQLPPLRTLQLIAELNALPAPQLTAGPDIATHT
jgi:hypothetical protein